MPTYEMQAPDGNKYRIDGPPGASDDQVRQQILQQHPNAGQKAASLEPVTQEKWDVGMGQILPSVGRAASNLPGSVGRGLGDIWHAVTHYDEVYAALKEKGFSGIASAIGDDLKEHYGSLERAKRTFETDPFKFVTDMSIPLTGGAGAAKLGLRIGREILPEVAATARAPAAALRTAGEAGALGGPEAAEYRAGVAGRPSPIAAASRGAPASQAMAAQQAMAPFGQAGQDIRSAGFMPPLNLKTMGKLAAGHIGGVPAWAAPLLSPRIAGRTMFEMGRGERMIPTPPRSAIITAASGLLQDRDAKRGLDSDQLKTIRKVAKGDAPSADMLSASRIMQALIPSAGAQEAPQYGGMDAGRSTASTSGLAQQTPSPGEASQPKAAGMDRNEQSPQLSGQGALPLPGQSPGLSKLPTTGEAPIAATRGGKTFMQFAWEHALKGTKDFAAELKEAGRTAFEEPEKFDPRAPTEAAMAVVGGGTPFAARGALGAAGGKLVTPEGLAVPGKEFARAAGEASSAVEKMPKGAGPIDLSGKLKSDVPQVAIPRYEPPRGLSPRMQDALKNPAVTKGLRESMQQGIKLGAENWYHNEPIRKAFIKELGPVEGAQEFARFMDQVAATSPRSDVPTNIRNASYYYLMTGRELPTKLPYPPYGHLAQALHRGNISQLEQAMRGTVGAQHKPEWGGWDIFKNPKPVSFSQDLQGNLVPVAADTHAMRNVAMRTGDPRWLETSISERIKPGKQPSEFQRAYGEIKQKEGKTVVTYRPQQLIKSGRMSMKEAKEVPPFWVAKPTEGEYGAIEKLYGDVAKPLGLAPAEGQSAAWSGAGKLTGLGTPPDKTFAEMFNERVMYTSLVRKEKPEDTLRYFIRKKKPLLGFGGMGLLGAAAAGKAQQDEPAGNRQ